MKLTSPRGTKLGALLAAAIVLLLPDGTAAARGQEIAPVAPEVESTSRGASELPSPAELRALVAPAESVAVKPHAVKLESFRADTISGVYLVDSDLPSARHVAFGRDAEEHRYVWFSRRTPLRSSLVALYQVDGEGLPDVLYWRQVDHEGKVARAREFKAPAAAGVTFEYSSGPPCGKPVCEEGWQELPLERIAVEREFFEPLGTLYDAAATHGEEHLDRPVASLEGR